MKSSKVLLGVAVVALLLSGCGKKETPLERITRLRQQYTVQPNGFQPRVAADGTPEIALDVLVVNNGRDSLDSLTLLVHVVGQDGKDLAVARAVVDTGNVIPGVSQQISTIVPGLEVKEGDSVLVELEYQPPAEVLPLYPEYRSVTEQNGP